MGEHVNRWVIALGLLAVAAAAGVGAGVLRRGPPVDGFGADPTTSSVSAPMAMEVHVAGWVVDPGVVSLAEGSIVADAVHAAGGLLPGAQADAINLAAGLQPGEQVVIPGPGGLAAETVESDGAISLNRASATELEALPGVGPVLAGRIVAHRDQNGRFETVEDLLEVSGIGEAKLASIRDLVRP